MDFSQFEKNEDDDIKNILQEIGIEETYMNNALTQGAVSNEYMATAEEYFELAEPKAMIKFEDIKETSDKIRPLLSLLLMIVSLNDLGELTSYPKIRSLTYAILLIACACGCMKSDKKFKATNYNPEKEDFTTKKEDIKNVLDVLPVAKNFVALSVINYIRFNHHFPHEKIDLIKKSLIGIPENEVEDFLNSGEKNLSLFYKYPFQAAKLINEWAYFYTNINPALKMTDIDQSDIKMLSYGIIRKFISPDQMIIIRNEPTTNCFLILDLVNVFLTHLDSHEILGLLPEKKIFSNLMNIRNFLKQHPFTYHPARNYLQIKYSKDDFNKTVNLYHENIVKVGNLIYSFCSEEGGSLSEAKSITKYEHQSIGEFKNILEIYRITKDEQSVLSEEQKTKLKSLLAPKIDMPNSSEELYESNKKARKEIYNKEENIINEKD